jgi:ubiquinone/menaquinone biosynthesis C-methylase UbiE
VTQSVVPQTAPSLGLLEEVDDVLALKVQVVRAALELEVVPAVAAGHRDAESVALATGCSVVGMRILLDGLCALGLLNWSDGAYSLSPTAEAYLVPGKPTYCARMFLDDLRAGDHFAENIRTGQVPTDFASADSAGSWVAYAASSLITWPGDVAAYRERWLAVGVTAASVPGARILDVGCGSAIVSLVLALDDPTAMVTGIDWGRVIEVASRLAEAMGVAPQASFVAGDVTALGDLDGPFDIVFLGYVLHFLDPIEIGSTLRQLHRLLAPSGRIVIREVFSTPGVFDDPSPYLDAVWLYNVARRGRVYTFEEYASMLAEAGFGSARRLEGTPWLQAERSQEHPSS